MNAISTSCAFFRKLDLFFKAPGGNFRLRFIFRDFEIPGRGMGE